MSLNRYAKRRDLSEKPIVDALERVGFHVWLRDEPDLMVRKDGWPPGMVQLLEVKTVHSDRKKIKTDKRQDAQRNFIASTGTPIVRTPLEALRAVGAIS